MAFCRHDGGWRHNRQRSSDGNFDGPNDVRHLSRSLSNETKTAEGTAVPPMTITMKPADAADGKASKFVGSDPGLGNVADFAGTVSGEVDGKPSQGEFKE